MQSILDDFITGNFSTNVMFYFLRVKFEVFVIFFHKCLFLVVFIIFSAWPIVFPGL